MMTQETLPAVELETDETATLNARFEAEKKAFQAMKERLLEQYEGLYVAVHDGRVIDYDADKLKLGLRVYKQFGYQPVYVQRVSREGLPIRHLASPQRMEQP